jgi:hypothetical protein
VHQWLVTLHLLLPSHLGDNGANINNFIIFAKNLKRKDYEGK